MLDTVKKAVRVSHNLLDDEITDLIEEARHDLMLSGVSIEKVYDDEDPLIKRAIKTYARAQFGFSEQDKDRMNSKNRYQESYDMLKNHLTLSGDYCV